MADVFLIPKDDFEMAKKIKGEKAIEPVTTAAAVPDVSAKSSIAETTKKRARGRPKGSKSAKKAVTVAKKKAGRPKGSKNRPKNVTVGMKRPRGRPPGSTKKATKVLSGNSSDLRSVITQIVRDEVHSALLAAFKAL